MTTIQYIAAGFALFVTSLSAHWLWCYVKSVFAFLQFIDTWSDS